MRFMPVEISICQSLSRHLRESLQVRHTTMSAALADATNANVPAERPNKKRKLGAAQAPEVPDLTDDSQLAGWSWADVENLASQSLDDAVAAGKTKRWVLVHAFTAALAAGADLRQGRVSSAARRCFVWLHLAIL